MRKKMAMVVIALLCVSLVAPTVVLAQELPISPDLVPPASLVVFGFLSLVGGTVGYIWRQRQ